MTKDRRLDIPQSIREKLARSEADGKIAAQLFVFYRQFVRDKVEYELPFDRVPYKVIFNRNKARFENLAKLFNSKRIDINGYIWFFVFDYKKTESDIKEHLLNNMTLTFYIDQLKHHKKLNDIMKWFISTSKFIAQYCVDNQVKSSTAFFQDAISQKKLAQYCLSGKISKYYLVGIPRFDKVIPKLDYFSRCELKPLCDAYDVYKRDLVDAFKYASMKPVNPLRYVDNLIDEMIFKKLSEKIA